MASIGRIMRRGLGPGVALCAGGVAVSLGAATAAAAASSDFDSAVARAKVAGAPATFKVDFDLSPSNPDVARLSARPDMQMIWQTLRPPSIERGLKRVALWRWTEEKTPPLAAGVVAGRARLGALVEVGDQLNGHVGLVHGGFTAAILDDLFGWCAGAERAEQGLPDGSLVFTANLDVNYRRPMPCDARYYVQVEAGRLEKGKKIYLTGTVFDEAGRVCIQATSLYIVKVPPAPAREG